MATHASEFAVNDRGDRFLWTLHATDGEFECKVWGLTPKDFEMLLGPGASFDMLSNPEPVTQRFPALSDVFGYFSGSADAGLAKHAAKLINKIAPGTYPG